MRSVRIATRASRLALAQSGQVARALEAQLGWTAELLPVTTRGDRIQSRPMAAIGGKGLFVKEIEQALLDGRADLAVHSVKDLPARGAPGLSLLAFPQRADPRDAWIGGGPRRGGLEALRPGARVGTGSVRRASQLRAWRADLEVVPLRGNVETRLRKLEVQELDGVILACAGLERLELASRIQERVSPDRLLPAVGQGALAIQGRAGEAFAGELQALDHRPTRARVLAERAFLSALEGDCSVPLAALAELEAPERLHLRGLVASPDGCRVVRGELRGPVDRAEELGSRLARQLRQQGAGEILAALGAGAKPPVVRP